MSRRQLLPTLALALVLALTPACGSGNDDGGGGDASSAESTDDGSGARGEPALEFAQCMRDNGVEDFPDPEITEDGGVIVKGGGPEDPDVYEAAQEACQGILDDARSGEAPDPEREAQMQEQALAFAECMREHGIDFPDPEFEDGRMRMAVGEGEGVDPESPEFADAEQACQGEMTSPGGEP